ncbi:MAG: DUF2182 domain-containing protein, partial [Mesorhizobium sp.]
MATQDNDFSHLDAAGRAAAAVARSPRITVTAVLGLAVLLAWLVLGAMAVRGAEGGLPGAGAPGDFLLLSLPSLPLPDALERFAALCLTPLPVNGGWSGAEASALVLMWFLMAVAAMLPSAAPMI